MTPFLTNNGTGLLSGEDEQIMSFDRLMANPLMADAITVKATGVGKYLAVSIPPVFATGPSLADRLLHIDGMAEAIGSNEEIERERREFLKERIIYWKEWASTSSRGIITPSDRE